MVFFVSYAHTLFRVNDRALTRGGAAENLNEAIKLGVGMAGASFDGVADFRLTVNIYPLVWMWASFHWLVGSQFPSESSMSLSRGHLDDLAEVELARQSKAVGRRRCTGQVQVSQ